MMHHQHKQKNYSYDGGYEHRPRGQGRGRTFYRRNANHPLSATSASDSNGQKYLNEVSLKQNGETNHDISRPDYQMNDQAPAYSERPNGSESSQSNWHSRNGYRRNENSRGGRLQAYNDTRQQARMPSAQTGDDTSESWSPRSSDSVPLSTPKSDASAPSSVVVPVLPETGEVGASADCSSVSPSQRNVWKERQEFYHSARPKDENEEDLMFQRAIEESQKLEEERQRQILQETTSHFSSLSVNFEDDTAVKSVEGDSMLLTSVSSSVDVVLEPSPVASCEPGSLLPDDAISSLSSDDVTPPAVMEKTTFHDLGTSGVSDDEIREDSCLQGSSECCSPCGLVAFSQSSVSAFSSVTAAKHATSPVVVPGCDQRMRDSCRDTKLCTSTGSSCVSEEPACNSSSPYSLTEKSDEPVQSFSESQSVESDAESHERIISSPSAVDESCWEKQLAVANEPALPAGNHSIIPVAHPSYIPVPLGAFPPPAPCYHHPHPPSMMIPAYMPPMPPYPPGVSVIQQYPYPYPYQMIPQHGMVSPCQMGMAPMMYPGPMMAPPAVPCWAQPPVMTCCQPTRPLPVQNQPSHLQ